MAPTRRPTEPVADGLATALVGIAQALGVDLVPALRDDVLTRVAYSPSEVADMVGLTEWTVRGLISRGELRAVKLRRRILIPRQALTEFLGTDTLPKPETAPEPTPIRRRKPAKKAVAE
jgi:excisionase family DNA binding protein